MKFSPFYIFLILLLSGFNSHAQINFKNFEFSWCKPFESYKTSFANRDYEQCDIPIGNEKSTNITGWRTFYTVDIDNNSKSGVANSKDIFNYYHNLFAPYIDTLFYRGPLLYCARLCKDEKPVYVCVQYANKGNSYFVTVVETDRFTNNFAIDDITKNIERNGSFTYYINSLRGDSDLNKHESTFLEGTIRAMKKYPQMNLIISVNTDNIGNHDKLVELSNLKAHQLYDALVKMGANPNRINFVGYGPDRPTEDNSTCQGRMLNNRVVLRVKTR